MFKAVLPVVLCSVVLTGCAIHKVPGTFLTASELNTNVANYNGQTIEMRGYIVLGPESRDLFESKRIFSEIERGYHSGSRDFDMKKYDKDCVTIANPDFLFRNGRTVNYKTLIIRGKFIDDYLGPRTINLDACSPTAIIIDEEDLRHRYPALLPVR